MPYINVKITDENVSLEQKREIVRGCTKLMVDILNKDPQLTFVVIDEVSVENWGWGESLVADIRQQSNGKPLNK